MDKLLEPARETAAGLGRQGRGRLGAELVEQHPRRLGDEGRAPGEHLPHDQAEGVEVRAGPERLGVDLLGAHVLEGPDAVGGVAGDRLHDLGDTEVHDLDPPVGEQHDVLGLEVAVDDRRLGPVRGRERGGDLPGDRRDEIPGQRALAVHPRAQGLAVEVLEGHDQLAVGLGAVEAADDVGVVEAGEDRHLVDEGPPPGLAPGQLAAQDLERDPALGQALLGLVDLAHPALAEQPVDQEVADRPRLCHRLLGPVVHESRGPRALALGELGFGRRLGQVRHAGAPTLVPPDRLAPVKARARARALRAR